MIEYGVKKKDELIREIRQMEIQNRDRKGLAAVLSTEDGRWFLMRLLDTCCIMQTTFTGNSQSFFNEGRRSVGIDIVKNIATLLGVKGIEQKQLAELEYIQHQERINELITRKVGESNGE